MTADDTAGWSDFGWHSWKDLALVRARLDAGADPNDGAYPYERPLRAAAERGTPEVVAELAGRVDDVDAECEGRTALATGRLPRGVRNGDGVGSDEWPDKDQPKQPQRHEQRSCPPGPERQTPRSAPTAEFLAPTGVLKEYQRAA